jgi:glycosyltransferase involved in cell wall biosynthesis
MFQENLLLGFKHAGLEPSLIVCAQPFPAFPYVRQLWVRGGTAKLKEGLKVQLVAFPNVTPIKQITIGLNVLWELLKWGWRTRKAVTRVVYTYNLTVPPGLFTWLASRLISAKAVVSFNDINVPGQTVPDSAVNKLDFWLQKKLAPRFDGHVAVSDAIMQDLLPGKPYIRMEGAVSDEVFAPRQPVNKGDRFRIVFAGSLDAVNGVEILLEAFSQLRGSHYELVIAGWGPQEALVRAASQRDDRIQYIGTLPFSELLQLYSAADVLLSMRPTKTLNTKYFFPSKVMEYLASGTPMIATCTGHTEDEFGDFCYLLRDETPSGLARLIREVSLIPRAEREMVGMRARLYMKNNKTWDRQAQKVLKFIREHVIHEPTGNTTMERGAESGSSSGASA